MRTLGAAAVLMQGFLHTVILRETGWGPGEHVHFVATFLSFSVVGVPLVWLLVRAGPPAAVLQLVAGSIMAMALLAVVGNPDNHGGQASFYDIAYLVLYLPPLFVAAMVTTRVSASRWFLNTERDWRLMALAGAALVPASIAALEQELTQRNSWPPAADPHHNAHWLVTGIAVLAPVVLALVAALRVRGWRLPLWTAALMALSLGATSAVFADDTSSLGLWWGLALVGWAVAIVVVGERTLPTYATSARTLFGQGPARHSSPPRRSRTSPPIVGQRRC